MSINTIEPSPVNEASDNGRLSLDLGQDDIAEEMRRQQIASLDDVEWAIVEANGSISFIKQS